MIRAEQVRHVDTMVITREQSNAIVDFVLKYARGKAGFIVTPTGTISVHQYIWDWLGQRQTKLEDSA